MKKTCNLIIVDASTSMQSKKEEVIGGLKLLFSQIKEDAIKDKKKVKCTTVVVDFSSPGDFNVIVNSVDSSLLNENLAEKYKTRGMTALYDAIGKGFELIPKGQDSVFINILTDGEENSSQEFKATDVQRLISEAKSKNWAVTFMGTTEASITTAKTFGISSGNTFQFTNDSFGVNTSMEKLRRGRSAYYATNASYSAGETVSMDNLMSDLNKEDKKL